MAIESCLISNKQYRSLDFALNGCFGKIFRTKSAEVVQNRMQMINCLPIQTPITKRWKCRHKFLVNYITSNNRP